jgi:hypothetical protein
MIVANDDAYVVLRGQTLSGATSVLFNDDGALQASASAVLSPSNGSLQLSAAGVVSYTPNAGFTGIDFFEYEYTNNVGTLQDASVFVHVVPVVSGATTTLGLTALTPEEQIAATYVAFFGRAADAAGFNFWVGEFNAGLPVQGPAALFSNIASSFGVGDEAKGLYPFLSNPAGASDGQIGSFLNSVYDNLFNRTPDSAGLAYWTGEIKATLAAGQFVGSVLVNIMSGAQNTGDGQDITTLMSKVAVSLRYVEYQLDEFTQWTQADDGAEAVALLAPVTFAPQTVLVGIANALDLVLADITV